jgi:hypothetical protein
MESDGRRLAHPVAAAIVAGPRLDGRSSPSELKRAVNELMTGGEVRGHAPAGPLPLFCECGEPHCYQAVWLTASEYRTRRAGPAWWALASGHQSASAGPPSSVTAS